MSILHDDLKQLPFYLTRPQPCPYLAGQVEQKIFTRLTGEKKDDFLLNSTLNQNGFRRSQSMVYRPACPACMACVPVRINLHAFEADARLRRISRKNADLETQLLKPDASDALFPLFSRYQKERHGDSDMSDMPFEDYGAMMKDGGENAFVLTLAKGNAPVAAMLVDKLHNGTSAVYSFFEPSESKRSLGNEMVLRLIDYTVDAMLDYVYLGYWIRDCRKMAYKASFPALQRLGPHGWEIF